ncbi:MAG: class I SAM-dependent methyltransferase, partial [Gammaproteobacteria bacterium]
KTLALLEDELLKLKPQLRSDSLIIAAGMVKSLPPSVRGLFEKILGPTDLSLAQKKARLLFVTYDDRLPQPKNPYPVEYRLEGTEFSILNHANVFSRDRLDIGTRFLLQHMPHRPDATDIVDLGCGNGILGLIAARDHPLATVHFADESYMAVASARRNFETAFGTERRATFCVGDCLEGFSKDSADLVLCNPPFHQQTAIGDAVARKMFKQARNILRPGGELRVVGNRHLGYHRLLQQGFERVEVAAAKAKFVILSATA